MSVESGSSSEIVRSSFPRFPLDIPSISIKWQNKGRNQRRISSRPNFSYENQEFLKPEYLDSQKRSLLQEIVELRAEINPLKEQYRVLKMQIDSQQDNDEAFEQHNISADLADSHSELDSLKAELAKLRRFYTESTQKRLEKDIEYQKSILIESKQGLERLLENLDERRSEYKDTVDSPLAETILRQRHQIEELIKKRDSLLEIEDQLIERHRAQFDDTPLFVKANSQITSLKRKLKNLEHQEILIKVEHRKKKTEFEAEEKKLRLLLETKNTKRVQTTQNSKRPPSMTDIKREETLTPRLVIQKQNQPNQIAPNLDSKTKLPNLSEKSQNLFSEDQENIVLS